MLIIFVDKEYNMQYYFFALSHNSSLESTSFLGLTKPKPYCGGDHFPLKRTDKGMTETISHG
jgi:hypothetical protein